VSYLAKTPIALQILFAGAMFTTVRRPSDSFATAFLWLPVIAYFAGVSLLGWNIG